MPSRKARREAEAARMAALMKQLEALPCRAKTGLAYAEDGACARCLAANGEACRGR